MDAEQAFIISVRVGRYSLDSITISIPALILSGGYFFKL